MSDDVRFLNVNKKKRKRKKDRVRIYWTGYQPMPIHGRDPTNARHGNFCLLYFHPGPVRPSLDNLDLLSSPERPILMPSLVRTPDRHSTPESRTPTLNASSDPDLQVAGLQEHATTPSRLTKSPKMIIFTDFVYLFNFYYKQ